ncbi:MAG: glycosyltransferase [Planctomycetota bacterium]
MPELAKDESASSDALGRPTRAAETSLTPEWRDYFLRLVQNPLRFSGPRNYLGRDMRSAMRRLVPQDAKVLEVGTGKGDLLAELPNARRHGIDVLPEAVAATRARDSKVSVEQADALTFASSERYDAVICDRLCHSIPDVQKLLANLAEHLSADGRIFLTCFNFIWAIPLLLAAKLGFYEKAPEQNWLSESDFENLFALAGVEVVHSEDRILVPLRIPLLDFFLNRFLAKLPPWRFFSLYRIYVLRPRIVARPVPKVTVIVPARNESGNIQGAIDRTPVMGSGTELIFVEGNSTDDTYARIEQGIRDYKGPLQLSLHKQPGKGKGDACRVGYAKATGDLVLILDADLTVPPEDLPKFYDVMVRGLADYVHGTRMLYPMEQGAMRFLNKLGNATFAKIFSFVLDKPIQDTLCGTKVLWRKDYERIAANRAYFGDFDPFGDFDLIFGASKLNLKIMEIPIRYKNRTYGETNISRFRDGFLLLRMSIFAARKLKFV